MNTILSLLTENNVKRIVVEKENVVDTKVENNHQSISLNLQISVEYVHQSDVGTSMTFGEYILDWLYNVKANELKPSSFDRKEQTVKYQVIPHIGDIDMHNLSAEDIQKMINALKKEYSYSTIKKAYECVNACLKYAVKRRFLPYNVAESVVIPKNLEREISDVQCFTDDKVEKIEKEAVRCYKNGKRIYRMGEIVILIVNTGLRIGEALALEWSDINFRKKTLKVRKNMVYVKSRSDNGKAYQYIKQKSTKTKKGSRIVPLNSAAIRALISLKGINGNTPYVFATSKGNRVTPRVYAGARTALTRT
ncbi:tyrosine-type recombinase/integrase [Ruminococcus flavefaciens]|uniref:tyrosine-type recombinase/integrase n=1 Tax=Ruminococcus flavefaciens TaxID=1265 RepID=UPI0026ED4A40|nr:tyrosine-type recombinase/integrase [Ruminococcus flavefaciens]